MTDGGRTGVVLSEPLNGGSSEGWVSKARADDNPVKEVDLGN
jgi:hypothetical protein